MLIENPPTKPLSEYLPAKESNEPLIPERYVYCLQVPWGQTAAGKQHSFLPEVTEEITPVAEMNVKNVPEQEAGLESKAENVVPQAGRVSQCGLFKVAKIVAIAATAVAISYLSFAP